MGALLHHHKSCDIFLRTPVKFGYAFEFKKARRRLVLKQQDKKFLAWKWTNKQTSKWTQGSAPKMWKCTPKCGHTCKSITALLHHHKSCDIFLSTPVKFGYAFEFPKACRRRLVLKQDNNNKKFLAWKWTNKQTSKWTQGSA